MKDLITVTDRAASQIKKIIKEANDEVLGVVVGVDKTGCSGYAYKLDYAKDENSKKFEKSIFLSFSKIFQNYFRMILRVNKHYNKMFLRFKHVYTCLYFWVS